MSAIWRERERERALKFSYKFGCMVVFTKSLHYKQDVTQGQFLSKEKLDLVFLLLDLLSNQG